MSTSTTTTMSIPMTLCPIIHDSIITSLLYSFIQFYPISIQKQKLHNLCYAIYLGLQSNSIPIECFITDYEDKVIKVNGYFADYEINSKVDMSNFLCNVVDHNNGFMKWLTKYIEFFKNKEIADIIFTSWKPIFNKKILLNDDCIKEEVEIITSIHINMTASAYNVQLN
jgi:hypothetical protein